MSAAGADGGDGDATSAALLANCVALSLSLHVRIASRFTSAEHVAGNTIHDEEGGRYPSQRSVPAPTLAAKLDAAVASTLKDLAGFRDVMLGCAKVQRESLPSMALLLATSTTKLLRAVESALIITPALTTNERGESLRAAAACCAASLPAVQQAADKSMAANLVTCARAVLVGYACTLLHAAVTVVDMATTSGSASDVAERLSDLVNPRPSSHAERFTSVESQCVMVDAVVLPAMLGAAGEEGAHYMERCDRARNFIPLADGGRPDTEASPKQQPEVKLLWAVDGMMEGLAKSLSARAVALGLYAGWLMWRPAATSRVSKVEHSFAVLHLDDPPWDVAHSLMWCALDVKTDLSQPQPLTLGLTAVKSPRAQGEGQHEDFHRQPLPADVVSCEPAADIEVVRLCYAGSISTHRHWQTPSNTLPSITWCLSSREQEDQPVSLTGVELSFLTRAATPREVRLTMGGIVVGTAIVSSDHTPRTPVLVELLVPAVLDAGERTSLTFTVHLVPSATTSEIALSRVALKWTAAVKQEAPGSPIKSNDVSIVRETRPLTLRPMPPVTFQQKVHRKWLESLPLRRLLVFKWMKHQHSSNGPVPGMDEEEAAEWHSSSERALQQLASKVLRSWGVFDSCDVEGAWQCGCDPCTVEVYDGTDVFPTNEPLSDRLANMMRQVGAATAPTNLDQARDAKHRWWSCEVSSTTLSHRLRALGYAQPDATLPVSTPQPAIPILEDAGDTIATQYRVLRGVGDDTPLQSPSPLFAVFSNATICSWRDEFVRRPDTAFAVATLAHVVLTTDPKTYPGRQQRITRLLACGLEDHDRTNDRTIPTHSTALRALGPPRAPTTLDSAQQRLHTAFNAVRALSNHDAFQDVTRWWSNSHLDDAGRIHRAITQPLLGAADEPATTACVCAVVCCFVQWAPPGVDTDALAALREELQRIEPSLEELIRTMAFAITGVSPTAAWLVCGHCLPDGAFARDVAAVEQDMTPAFGNHLLIPRLNHKGHTTSPCISCRTALVASWVTTMSEHPTLATA